MPTTNDLLKLTAINILAQVASAPAHRVFVVYSASMQPLADSLLQVAQLQNLPCRSHQLDGFPGIDKVDEGSYLQQADGQYGLILLFSPEHANFMFEIVGRPDRGIKLSTKHLFCNWLMPFDGLLHTYGVDMEELTSFQQTLASLLPMSSHMRITTPAGTDLSLTSRHWHITTGEYFTSPIEESVNGTAVFDGSVYYGPVRKTFTLRITEGRVTNLSELDLTDEQQRMAFDDLTRDVNASIVAEFSLGINPVARWDADVMEAEQSRGTCHVGFGHNIEYGGVNTSSTHFDFVMRHPTVIVGDKTVCIEGRYQFSYIDGV